MSSVDSRVVEMKFNNSGFERAASTTISTLDKLKKSLGFSAPKNGLGDIENQASRFHLGNVVSAIDGVSKKFSLLRLAGVGSLVAIGSRAVTAGLSVLKSFTLTPIMDGFRNYETRINAVQTIMANTGLKGSKGLGQINSVLADLNTYANKTIYNFSEMTKNIGTFTAAGVDLKTSAAAIKGIANLAAMSGSNSQQASTAMYQLSQSIAAGKVGLQDWNSVVNAGMGGQVFQKALFNTAEAMHTIKGVKMGETFDEWKAKGNTFRNSLKEQWLTGKVLTTTLKGFTGDLSTSQLKAIGYTAKQIQQIKEMGKTANDAATQIKTATQLQQALKEEVATAYGAVFKTIFGDIGGATKMWSALHTVAENALTNPIYALNRMLEGVVKLGGRTKIIDAFKNVFKDLGAVMKPIKQAFTDIIPATTAKKIYDLIVRFDDFTKRMKISDQTAYDIWRTFRGVFAIFDIGKQVVTGIIHVLVSLFDALRGGSGSVLNVTGNIGDFLVKLDETLKKGGGIKDFFNNLAKYVAVPVAFLGTLRNAFFGLFDGINQQDLKNLSDGFGRVGARIASLSGAARGMGKFFTTLWQEIQPGMQKIIQAFQGIGTAIANAFKSGNFSQVLDTLNTGLLAGIALLIRNFFKKGLSVDVSGGMFGSIKEVFEGLTGNLKAMQQQTKAKTLLEIAGAIAVLAASAVALAMVDSGKLTASMTALAVGFGELMASMKILAGIGGSKGFLKIPIIAASLDLLAGAILILVIAVRALAKLDVKELTKGLTAVGALLGMLTLATKPLAANAAGMIRAGIGITALAVALNLMYFAVKDFAKLSWTEMGKGLAGVSGSLLAIAGAMRLMPRGMALQAAGIVEISVALLILAKAVSSFATMDWTTMGRGMAGVAGSLLIIAGAMQLMPKGLVIQAAGLVLVGAALQIIGDAVHKMGDMSWSEIGKGLTTLAGALAILAGAMYLMTGAVAGAVALTVVSVGLLALSKVLQTFAGMSWGDIIKGLVGLAATFAVIGVTGLLIAPVVPILLAFGAAMVLIGGGFVLFGVGALATATAIGILAKAGQAGFKLLLDSFLGIVKMLPKIGTNLAQGVVNFAVVITKNAPIVVGALAALASRLLLAVVKLMPQMVRAFTAVISAILTTLQKNFPKILAVGFNLLMQLLHGISNNIGRVTTTVVTIIVRFLNAVANNLKRITNAGFNLLVRFLQGIGGNIGLVADAVGSIIARFLTGIGNAAGRIVNAGFSMISHIITGIGNGLNGLVTAGTTAIISFIQGLGKNGVRLANAAGQTLLDFINGLDAAVKNYEWRLLGAGWNLVKDLIQGMVNGIGDLGANVMDAIGNLASSLLARVKHVLHIGSPSKVMHQMGVWIVQGWIDGLHEMHGALVDKAGKMSNDTISQVQKSIAGMSGSLDAHMNLAPTITPVLDLSQVRKDAAKLNDLVPTTSTVSPRASFAHASGISVRNPAAQQAAQMAPEVSAAGTTIKFEQHNTSPKALSTLDIYRQTKNQLTQAKKLLGVP